MLDTILDSPLSSWLQLDTDATDHIVISSRIRLARNFDGILFTNRNDMSSLEKVCAGDRSPEDDQRSGKPLEVRHGIQGYAGAGIYPPPAGTADYRGQACHSVDE